MRRSHPPTRHGGVTVVALLVTVKPPWLHRSCAPGHREATVAVRCGRAVRAAAGLTFDSKDENRSVPHALCSDDGVRNVQVLEPILDVFEDEVTLVDPDHLAVDAAPESHLQSAYSGLQGRAHDGCVIGGNPEALQPHHKTPAERGRVRTRTRMITESDVLMCIVPNMSTRGTCRRRSVCGGSRRGAWGPLV